mgnify:CR=1 FL=1
MTVPISGRFNMFPLSNSTSIQGSVDAGGGTVPDDSDFDTIIAQSTPSLFHPTYAGTITALSQISSSCQYRGYPHIVTAASIRYASFQGSACTAQPSTYYINTTSSTRFDLATIIWSNSAGTTFANAGWYSNGTIRRNWDGSAFTTTVNCSSGNPVRYRYYISAQGSTSAAGYPTSDFQSVWCGSAGVLLAVSVWNESNSNVAGTTDNIFYTSATGTGKFNGTGGSSKYFCISTISGQNTNSIVSKQYTQINNTGDGLDAGTWACNGNTFSY